MCIWNFRFFFKFIGLFVDFDCSEVGHLFLQCLLRIKLKTVALKPTQIPQSQLFM